VTCSKSPDARRSSDGDDFEADDFEADRFETDRFDGDGVRRERAGDERFVGTVARARNYRARPSFRASTVHRGGEPSAPNAAPVQRRTRASGGAAAAGHKCASCNLE